jgi:transcriptional regulator with XRE-family HTH domain
VLTRSPLVCIFTLVKRTYPDLGTFLKATHTKQDVFAKRFGIAPSFVSMIVNGQRTPSLPLALRIAEYARVPLESLVSVRDGESIAS